VSLDGRRLRALTSRVGIGVVGVPIANANPPLLVAEPSPVGCRSGTWNKSNDRMAEWWIELLGVKDKEKQFPAVLEIGECGLRRFSL
jgi:hypothetical protein